MDQTHVATTNIALTDDNSQSHLRDGKTADERQAEMIHNFLASGTFLASHFSLTEAPRRPCYLCFPLITNVPLAGVT